MYYCCRYCIICGNNTENAKALHCFPRSLARLREWGEALKIENVEKKVKAHWRICSEHFSANSYANNWSATLNRNAVPSQYIQTSKTEIIEENALQPPTVTPPGLPVEPLMVTNEDIHFSTPIKVPSTHPVPSTSKGSASLMYDTSMLSSLHETPTSSCASINFRQNATIFSTNESKAPSISRSLFKKCDLNFSCTPREKKLRSILKQREKQLQAVKKLCKQRGKELRQVHQIKNLDKNPLVNNLFEGLSPVVANFLVAQVRWSKQPTRARRWSLEDKLFALLLFKRSPSCYALMRRFLALPSRSTLTALLSHFPLKPGINLNLFQHLQSVLAGRPPKDSFCTLMFDEMSILEHLEYNRTGDCFVGLENLGHHGSSAKIANHALVFMVQGVGGKWKQPLAFYFSHGPVSSDKLQLILLDVLDTCSNHGLNVVTCISYMGTNNVKTFKSMGATESQPFFVHKGKRIFCMFDPPHLIKCLRNNFLKHPIQVPVLIGEENVSFTARWDHLLEAKAIDDRSPVDYRTLKKLTDAHFHPSVQQTMKVKLAAQIFSHSFAAYIHSLISTNSVSNDRLGTAQLLKDGNKLFDSLNGFAQGAENGKEVHCVVTWESKHWSFWEEMLEMIPKWQFLRDNNTVCSPPSQTGWQLTVKSFTMICTELLQSGEFTSVRPRSFNQDPLENLFGAIRSSCGANDTPTAAQFISALKTQVVCGLSKGHLKGGNCEADNAKLLSDFRHLFEGLNQQLDQPRMAERCSVIVNISSVIDVPTLADEIELAVLSGSPGIFSTAYVSGYIAKKLLEKSSCDICKSVLITEPSAQDNFNIYISNKEFSTDKHRLIYPSEKLVKNVGIITNVMEAIVPQLMNDARDVQHRIATSIFSSSNTENLFEWISCDPHRISIAQCIVAAVGRVYLRWYATGFNRKRKSQRKARTVRKKLKKLGHPS
ncbi:uncharacterized protein LOC135127045 isoform X1 [Zophobas morio]|uniref:uncharacterized protein LOC135127045 isoform X1 n=1 Tax=Zophobas morio TaxID=2755281 RepID=UPI003082BC8C